MFHLLAEDIANLGKPNSEKKQAVCPACGKDSSHWTIKDYDEMWRDGKVVCECGQFIRYYDAG
jgi:hypothetical protein